MSATRVSRVIAAVPAVIGVLGVAACGSSLKPRVGNSPAIEFANCMRAHGVPSFPDPTSTPPANPPANGLAIGRGGVFLVISDPHGPAFKHAAALCGFPRFH
jgi:hypothetical protein